MKIGFIDYYLDEWHANNYPNWIREASDGEMEVSLAYGMIDSPIGGLSLIHIFSGDGWSLELPRDVEWEEPRSVSTLGRIEYSFQSPDGVWHTAAIGPALEAALPFAAALGAFEAVLLLCHAAQAHRAAQKLLRPLDRMARDLSLIHI